MANCTPKFYRTRIVDSETAELLDFDYTYLVKRNGDIISLARYNNNYMKMTPHKEKDGYMSISLIKNGKTTCHRLHRIIACAFIPNPQNKPIINHIDGRKDNNCVDNLEWVTQKENAYHSIHVLGKWSRSEKQSEVTRKMGYSRRKLSIEDANRIREIYNSGEIGCYRLARMFGISKCGILRIIHNKSYVNGE